jgi:signal transduction histidine kinase
LGSSPGERQGHRAGDAPRPAFSGSEQARATVARSEPLTGRTPLRGGTAQRAVPTFLAETRKTRGRVRTYYGSGIGDRALPVIVGGTNAIRTKAVARRFYRSRIVFRLLRRAAVLIVLVAASVAAGAAPAEATPRPSGSPSSLTPGGLSLKAASDTAPVPMAGPRFGEAIVGTNRVPLVLLTNIQQVLALGHAGALTSPHPVRVIAVVTHTAEGPDRGHIVHDGTGGCVVTTTEPVALRFRQRVEIQGEVTPASFYPTIGKATFRQLGEGELPPPVTIAASRLTTGAHHAGWVRLPASVLDVAVSTGWRTYLVSSGGTTFNVGLRTDDPVLPLEQMNATVELVGVPWAYADNVKDANRFRLLLSESAGFRIVRPGSSNLFAGVRRTIRSVQEGGKTEDRVLVSGVVNFVSASKSLCLQDETASAWIYGLNPMPITSREHQHVPRLKPPPLRPGDRVEIVGNHFSSRPFSTQIHYAEYRVIGHEPLPPAPLVEERELMTGRWDGRQVRVRGRVVDREEIPGTAIKQTRLWVKTGEQVCYATYQDDHYFDFAAELGGLVEMTGVCAVSAGNVRPVRSFAVYLNAPADVKALPEPPAWLSPAVMKTAGVSSGVLALAFGWIWLLRRRVAHRTAALRAANTRLAAEVQEREKAEARLWDSLQHERELGELKSNFVSLVSHEFRTPLGVIMSATEVLQRYFERLPPEKRARHLDMIFRSTKNLSTLIDEVLLLGKVEEGRLRFAPLALDLERLCRVFVEEVASATNRVCPMQFVAHASLAQAVGDEALLRLILTNLLSNAVKYSEPGSPVEFMADRQGADVVLTVRDRGIGIPPEDQARLFHSFSRGHNVGERPGSGLGLVIVQRCVQLHGGSVELKSEPGQGTTATVRLPVFSAASNPPS